MNDLSDLLQSTPEQLGKKWVKSLSQQGKMLNGKKYLLFLPFSQFFHEMLGFVNVLTYFASRIG